MKNFLWFAWPWVGLLLAFVMLWLMFRTKIFRGKSCSRFKDGAWYAWLPMPAYLLHQFEEYACHVTNGQFAVPDGRVAACALPACEYRACLVWGTARRSAVQKKSADWIFLLRFHVA